MYEPDSADLDNYIRVHIHDWGGWLQYADRLACVGSATHPVLIRAVYSVLHGGWGVKELHVPILRAARFGYVMHNPTKQFAEQTFVMIPPGSYVMGSPVDEPSRMYTERQASVTITHGFWLGRQPVKNRQWCAVMGVDSDERAVCPPDQPVTDISWNDIQEFLARLNKKHPIPGWRFDLPTEAQWEYACRAGTNTAYAFGSRLSQRLANYGKPTITALDNASYFSVNTWGLYDMHGTVREICRDDFIFPLPGGVDPCSNGLPPGMNIVIRGGSWAAVAAECRSAVRNGISRRAKGSTVGFRLALVVDT